MVKDGITEELCVCWDPVESRNDLSVIGQGTLKRKNWNGIVSDKGDTTVYTRNLWAEVLGFPGIETGPMWLNLDLGCGGRWEVKLKI